MFIVQRIFEGAGDEGKDIRETLIRGSGNPDAALDAIKKNFPEDQEFKVTYNSTTRRFAVIPKGREDLLYHIVDAAEEALIDGVDSSSK